MKKNIFIFLLLSILSGCATKKAPLPGNQKTQIQYSDSIEGYSFVRSAKKINSTNLLFLKQFKDTIEIYLNNKKVDSFFKNDYHYENGKEYVVQDETPRIETRTISLKRSTENVITILLKPSNVKVSFDVRKEYDNYLVSHYDDNWYFTGVKSKLK